MSGPVLVEDLAMLKRASKLHISPLTLNTDGVSSEQRVKHDMVKTRIGTLKRGIFGKLAMIATT